MSPARVFFLLALCANVALRAVGSDEFCCLSLSAKCRACALNQDVSTFCQQNPVYEGCSETDGGVMHQEPEDDEQQQQPAEGSGSVVNSTTDSIHATSAASSTKEVTSEASMCCMSMTAECQACQAKQTAAVFCLNNPSYSGCAATDTGSSVQTMTITPAEDKTPSTKSPTSTEESMLCCMSMTATCQACQKGQTVALFCEHKPQYEGCDAVLAPVAAKGGGTMHPTASHAQGTSRNTTLGAAAAGGIVAGVLVLVFSVMGGYFVKKKRKETAAKNYGTRGDEGNNPYEDLL